MRYKSRRSFSEKRTLRSTGRSFMSSSLASRTHPHAPLKKFGGKGRKNTFNLNFLLLAGGEAIIVQ